MSRATNAEGYNPFGNGTTYQSLYILLDTNERALNALRKCVHNINPSIGEHTLRNVLPKFACPKHCMISILDNIRKSNTRLNKSFQFQLPKFGFCDTNTCVDGRKLKFRKKIRKNEFIKIGEYPINELTQFMWGTSQCQQRVSISFGKHTTEIDFHHYSTKTFKRHLQPKTDRFGRFSYVIGTKSKAMDNGTTIRSGSVYLELGDSIVIEVVLCCGDSDEEFDCMRKIDILGGFGYYYSKYSIAQQNQRYSDQNNSIKSNPTIGIDRSDGTGDDDGSDNPDSTNAAFSDRSRIVPCIILQHCHDTKNVNAQKDTVWLTYSHLKVYYRNHSNRNSDPSFPANVIIKGITKDYTLPIPTAIYNPNHTNISAMMAMPSLNMSATSTMARVTPPIIPPMAVRTLLPALPPDYPQPLMAYQSPPLIASVAAAATNAASSSAAQPFYNHPTTAVSNIATQQSYPYPMGAYNNANSTPQLSSHPFPFTQANLQRFNYANSAHLQMTAPNIPSQHYTSPNIERNRTSTTAILPNIETSQLRPYYEPPPFKRFKPF